MLNRLLTAKAVITFAIFEFLAILGGILEHAYPMGQVSFWDNEAALVFFLFTAGILSIYHTRQESYTIKAIFTASVIGVLLATALLVKAS
jgi:hypothetical protein